MKPRSSPKPRSTPWRQTASAWLLAGVMLSAGGVAFAQEAGRWNDLSPQQQEVLAPLREQWGQFDANQQRKWTNIANRYPGMKPGQRERIQQRMADWAAMTPEEHAGARAAFRGSKQRMDPQQRLNQWESYQNLADQERRDLAERRMQENALRSRGIAPSEGAGQLMDPRQAPALPMDAQIPKANFLNPDGARAPALSAVREGAQTPAHQAAGLSKVGAQPAAVDRNTMLPRKGPQGEAQINTSPNFKDRPRRRNKDRD